MADRFCSNCGQELGEENRFCPNCGRPLQNTAYVSTPEADTSTPPPPNTAQTAGSGGTWKKVALGCVTIPLLLIVIGGLLLGGEGGDTGTESPGGGGQQQGAEEQPSSPSAGDQSESQEAQDAQGAQGNDGMQTAIVRVGGTGSVPFTGSVGNIDNTRSVDGVTPAEYEVQFSGDTMDFDTVYVDFYKEMNANAEYPPGTLSAQIVVDGEMVQETSSSAEDGYLSLSWSPSD